MKFETKIPYAPDKQLAEAYNYAVESSRTPWVLLLDHDVFLAGYKDWFQLCDYVLTQVSYENTGLITCVTSGNTNVSQMADIMCDSTDLDEQIRCAQDNYIKNTTTLQRTTSPHVAGFFMLVNRRIWEKLGGFRQVRPYNIGKIDHDYCQRLLDEGYDIYSMRGLYVYHKRKRFKTNLK